MFEKIKELKNMFGSVRKKLSYKAEKELALSFYSSITLIFSFDDQIPKLCKKLNDLIRSDRNYNNLPECQVINAEIERRIHRLEFHNRKARIWLKKKKEIIDKLEEKIKSFGGKKKAGKVKWLGIR